MLVQSKTKRFLYFLLLASIPALIFSIAIQQPVTAKENYVECTPEVNDEITGAIDISSSLEFNVSFEPICASSNPVTDQQIQECGLNAGTQTIWYSFKATGADQALSVNTFGSTVSDTNTNEYDTFIAIWKGSPGSLEFVACNDDINSASLVSEVAFLAAQNVQYYIEVGEWDGYYSEASANSTGKTKQE